MFLGFDAVLDEFDEDAVVAEATALGEGVNLAGDLSWEGNAAADLFRCHAHQYTPLWCRDAGLPATGFRLWALGARRLGGAFGRVPISRQWQTGLERKARLSEVFPTQAKVRLEWGTRPHIGTTECTRPNPAADLRPRSRRG